MACAPTETTGACAPRPTGARSASAAAPMLRVRLPAPVPTCNGGAPDEVRVHAGDRIDADLLWARLLALAEPGAAAEELGVHLRDHAERAAIPLGLPLREEAQVGDLRGREERRRAVGTGRDAGAAADALGGVHRALDGVLGDGDRVPVGRPAGVHRDVATRLDDA